MSPRQLIDHYGGERQAAEALSCTRQIINLWKRNNRIPPKTQAWIQVHTGGALKASSPRVAV
jgi:DNA-binding transcriptional regulator Cro